MLAFLNKQLKLPEFIRAELADPEEGTEDILTVIDEGLNELEMVFIKFSQLIVEASLAAKATYMGIQRHCAFSSLCSEVSIVSSIR